MVKNVSRFVGRKCVFSHLLYRMVREMCYEYVICEENGVVNEHLEELINQKALSIQLEFDNLIDNILIDLRNE